MSLASLNGQQIFKELISDQALQKYLTPNIVQQLHMNKPNNCISSLV